MSFPCGLIIRANCNCRPARQRPNLTRSWNESALKYVQQLDRLDCRSGWSYALLFHRRSWL